MIRAATERDVDALHTLVLELARYERLEHEVLATPSDLREHLFGARKYAEALVAEDEDVVVGFALFFHNYSTFLAQPGIYLEDLFVAPRWRAHGLGKKLLAHLAALAVERGCGRLEWVVLDWNEPAIGFYKRLGAERMDGWTVFRVTGDALDRLAQPL
jgi:GNAT superfamily N-acetyltransferase